MESLPEVAVPFHCRATSWGKRKVSANRPYSPWQMGPVDDLKILTPPATNDLKMGWLMVGVKMMFFFWLVEGQAYFFKVRRLGFRECNMSTRIYYRYTFEMNSGSEQLRKLAGCFRNILDAPLDMGLLG